MRKLALSAFVVMLFFGTAWAHNGAVSLYKTVTPQMVCHMDIAFLQTDTISVYYVKDNGVYLGNAVEFKLVTSNPAAIFIGTLWTPQITVVLGDIDNGISLTAPQCLGAGEPIVYIGDVYVFFTDATLPAPMFTVRVVDNPKLLPPAINITECNLNQTIHSVLGGMFVFNGQCDPGVQTKSWGAIKELFK